MTDDLRAAVKPLEFEENRPGIWLSGFVLGGEYRIRLVGGQGFSVSRGALAVPQNDVWFQSLRAAVAAAQAHYADRILAALTDEALAALRAKMAEGE